MISMQQTYVGKGWDRGPHIYIASDAVRSEHRGVFVMTHPMYSGIHAGACNRHTFGVETVADWNKVQPTERQKAWLVDIAAALHSYGRFPANLTTHRDCMPGRTCPGQYGYAMRDELRTRLAMALHTTVLDPDHAPGGLASYTEDSPLLGQPRTSIDQVVDWFVTYRNPAIPAPPAPYTDADVQFIVAQYWEQTAAVGLDPGLVAAQLAHETGVLTSFWSQRPQRNPAGIGVTGQAYPNRPRGDPARWRYNPQRAQWEYGISFRSWERDSIPAHIGRLLAYCLPVGAGTEAQTQLIDQALRVRGLVDAMRGSAPILKALGRVHNPSGQGWASPGADYGQKIAQIANLMRGAGVT